MIKVYFYDPVSLQVYTETEVENTNGLENFTTIIPPQTEWNQYLVFDPSDNSYRIITMHGLPEETRLQTVEWWNKRKATYPDIGKQLDKLFDDVKSGKFGNEAKTGEWYQTIQQIKDSIPKQ